MMFAPVGVRRLEEAERHERRGRALLDDEEGDHQDGRRDQHADRLGRAPAGVVRLRQAVDEEHQARRDGDRAERVEVAREALDAALADEARDEEERRSTPIGTLTKKIHSQPAYSVRMPPSSTPIAAPEPAIAPRMPSALLRSAPSSKVTMRDREDRRREDRAGRALERPGGDQHPVEVEKPHRSEKAAKSDEADHEDLAPAEQVAGAPAEQQEAAEGERVAADDPLEVLGREVEVRPGSTAARRSRSRRRARPSGRRCRARRAPSSGAGSACHPLSFSCRLLCPILTT